MAVVDPIECYRVNVFKYDVFLYQCAIIVLYLTLTSQLTIIMVQNYCFSLIYHHFSLN